MYFFHFFQFPNFITTVVKANEFFRKKKMTFNLKEIKINMQAISRDEVLIQKICYKVWNLEPSFL